MCGRYTLATDLDDLIEVFDVSGVEFPYEPRWNIAPTQEAPVVAEDRRGRRMGLMRWGLIPWWADDPAIGNRQINARFESAHEKPAFRDAFERRRCLVPADGFYEWARLDGSKLPFWIHPARGELLSFAGLWDRWRRPEGDLLYSFTILTRPADEQVRDLHGRMPVIVPTLHRSTWLDRDLAPEEVRGLLGTFEPPHLDAREVSTWVNRPEHDDPSCVEPVGG